MFCFHLHCELRDMNLVVALVHNFSVRARLAQNGRFRTPFNSEFFNSTVRYRILAIFAHFFLPFCVGFLEGGTRQATPEKWRSCLRRHRRHRHHRLKRQKPFIITIFDTSLSRNADRRPLCCIFFGVHHSSSRCHQSTPLGATTTTTRNSEVEREVARPGMATRLSSFHGAQGSS